MTCALFIARQISKWKSSSLYLFCRISWVTTWIPWMIRFLYLFNSVNRFKNRIIQGIHVVIQDWSIVFKEFHCCVIQRNSCSNSRLVHCLFSLFFIGKRQWTINFLLIYNGFKESSVKKFKWTQIRGFWCPTVSPLFYLVPRTCLNQNPMTLR